MQVTAFPWETNGMRATGHGLFSQLNLTMYITIITMFN